MLKIGYASQTITPPTGTLMAGYDAVRKSVSVHDPLYCKILLVNNQKQNLCFVQFDTLCVGESFVALIKDVAIHYQYPKHNVFVGAIHTHSGAKGLFGDKDRTVGIEGIFGTWNQQIVDEYVSVFEKCLQKAQQNMETGQIKISYQYVHDICSERHDKTFPYDQKLWKLVFERQDGKRLLLYNFSCHPTILHADNLQISADLPGSVAEYLQDTFDFVIFFNGSAGDISTRFTRQGSDFREVERLGKKLAQQILDEQEYIVYEGFADNLVIEQKCYHLKARNQQSVLDMKAYLETMKDDCQYEDILNNYNFMKAIVYPLEHPQIDIEITYLKCGNVTIVMIPSEITSALTLQLTQKYNCLIFGYVNGYNLYISSQDAFEQKYYEASLSLIDKGEGEKLIQYIEQWIKNNEKRNEQ